MSIPSPRTALDAPAAEVVTAGSRARAELSALFTCSGRLCCANEERGLECAFDDRFWTGLFGMELRGQ